jgi:AcrR family transcriptional regulator
MVDALRPIASRRNAEETKSRILDALGRIIVRDGLGAVGINSLAREAGADKTLIYRYFDGLDGVYLAYAERGDIWHCTSEILDGIDPERMSLPDAVKLCLRRHARAIRSRPLTLAVLAGELIERTPLVVALEAVRDRRGEEIQTWLAERYVLPPGVDFVAMSALFTAAINYLALRARRAPVRAGVPIATDADWERLFISIDRLVDGIFAKSTIGSGGA